MIENLTKENFWNEMQEKYPKAMKKFCDWVDNYKKENDWYSLFNSGWSKGVSKSNEGHLIGGEKTKAPKYHQLPLALQYGIFVQFTGELYLKIGDVQDIRKDLTSNIIASFEIEEESE